MTRKKLRGKKLTGRRTKPALKRLAGLGGAAVALAGAAFGGYWLWTKSPSESESTTDSEQ